MILRGITFALLFFIPSLVMACGCVAPNRELSQEFFAKTDVIVKGRIISVSGGWSAMGPMAKIEIIEVIKGKNIPEIMTANYNNMAAACGHDLVEGAEDIFGFYDTRSLVIADNNSRGYGFRLMNSCHQSQIRYYLENNKINKNTLGKDKEK